jgi:copper chaperone CopZ
MSLSIVKKSYKITGMSCTLCVKLVESSVCKLGVF